MIKLNFFTRKTIFSTCYVLLRTIFRSGFLHHICCVASQEQRQNLPDGGGELKSCILYISIIHMLHKYSIQWQTKPLLLNIYIWRLILLGNVQTPRKFRLTPRNCNFFHYTYIYNVGTITKKLKQCAQTTRPWRHSKIRCILANGLTVLPQARKTRMICKNSSIDCIPIAPVWWTKKRFFNSDTGIFSRSSIEKNKSFSWEDEINSVVLREHKVLEATWLCVFSVWESWVWNKKVK